MALGFGGYVTIRSGIKLGILAGGAVWAMSWPMFAVATKRRLGVRPDFEDADAPTLRRPWSQVSDGWLSLFMWFFVVGAVVSAAGFAARGGRTLFGGLLPLGIDVLFLGFIWTERRRRRDDA